MPSNWESRCFSLFDEFASLIFLSRLNFGKKYIAVSRKAESLYISTLLCLFGQSRKVCSWHQCLIILMNWLSQKLHFIKSFCHCFVEVLSLLLRNLKIQWIWTRSFKARGFSQFKSKYHVNLGYMVTCCWLRWRDATHLNKENSPDCQMNWPAHRVRETKYFVWWGESRPGKSGIHERQKQSNLLHIPCLGAAEKQSLPLLPVTLGMVSCTLQLGFFYSCMTHKNIFQLKELSNMTLSWALNLFGASYIWFFFFKVNWSYFCKWRKWMSIHFKCICV